MKYINKLVAVLSYSVCYLLVDWQSNKRCLSFISLKDHLLVFKVLKMGSESVACFNENSFLLYLNPLILRRLVLIFNHYLK